MKPPTRLWLLVQPLALLELIIYIIKLPFLILNCPEGNVPVLILPGFLLGDWYMWPMKVTLKLKGYKVYGWKLGINRGYRDKINDELVERLKEINKKHDKKVVLIGYSLGGIYVRNIAHIYPELVSRVFTISTPFMNINNSVNIQNIYRFISGGRIENDISSEVKERVKKKLPVLADSIYSIFDGIVSLDSCIEPEDSKINNYGVFSTHCGMPHNYSVMKIILNKLSHEKEK